MSTKPENLTKLEAKLKIKFREIKLLKTAFIHRSYLNEHKEFKSTSNERLEFLGDSVLSLIVANHLYEHLPKSSEGELTQLRAALVRTETLSKIAIKLELGKYLYLSRGEEDSAGRANKTILADTFEALVGAIFLDQDPETTRKFIEKTILGNWQELAKSAVVDNKSKLQEKLQRKFHQSPTYRMISSWGPDHARNFEVGVFLENEELGRGTGPNKQNAAQNAAADALSRLKS